ncbi:MAG: site-specific integrase [Cyanobacteria bacterium P01_D01_bin.14]
MPRRNTKREKKGCVHVGERDGMLRLRWSHQGKDKQISLGLPDTPANRYQAEAKAAEIAADMLNGRYDPTLDKYRNHQAQSAAADTSTVALFDEFIAHKLREGTSGQTIRAKYDSLRSNIARLGRDVQAVEDARELVELVRSRQQPRTANQTLTLLKAFGEWMLREGMCDRNLFSDIRPLRYAKNNVQNRKPFTLPELTKILAALRLDRHRYIYYDFTYVMLSWGLRPSEVIGLQWKHVDLERREVTVCEALGRASDGRSSGRARERRATKTGDVRVFALKGKTLSLFSGRRLPDCKPDDLVFTSPTGRPIDDRNFRTRVWKPICEKAGVEYRPPYALRHTFTSHNIEQGLTLIEAASALGHSSTRMVSDTYGHVINRPELYEF